VTSPDSHAGSGILLARQAIYDRRLRIRAWELLFRAHNPDQADVRDGDHATSSVLINAFSGLPVADILEGRPAFINFTRRLLDFTPPISPAQLVVEVLEDVEIDADTVAAIARLKQQGYTIALDDYVYRDTHTELIRHADIIKVDVLASSMSEIEQLVERVQSQHIKLLAEKVETQAMFDACKKLGFELFQGYFLSRPQLVKGRTLKSDQRVVLQLLASLRKPDLEFREIERLIQTDSVLVLKMLRLVNSALFHLPRRITSIRQALTVLGMDRVRSWVQLLALSGLEKKPGALYLNAMVRARLGQQLAEITRRQHLSGDQQFTIGLLSTLDALLGLPLEQILDTASFSEEVRDAILQRSGDSGFLLDTVIAFEHGQFGAIDWSRLAQLGITADHARDAYIESLRWADEALKLISG
jgi:EAL and modified HD-GYP domain-containing signal transduction protein